MPFWRLVGWDLLILWRSGAAAAAITLLLAAAAFASYNGLRILEGHTTAIAEAQAQALTQISTDTATSSVQSPHTVRLRILAAEPPLLDFAAGRSGLDPVIGEATPLTPLHRTFENYQVDHPLSLALSRFDSAFLMTVVAPLILVALCAGLLDEEGRTGRLALLIAQGAQRGRIVLARVTARTMLVALPLVAALLAQAFASGLEGARISAFMGFLGVAILGLLIWAGFCVALNCLVGQRVASAIALFAVWLVLAATGPSVITAAAQAFAPAPPRLAFLADARRAEIAAVKDAESLAQAYLNDHPELEQGDFDVPGWARSRYLVSQSVDQSLAPFLSRFDASLERQIAIAASLQALTPTLAQSIAMTDIAGTSARTALDRQAEARTQVTALRKALGEAIMGGRGVSAAEAASWSVRFLPTQSAAAWPSLASLMLWLAAVWTLALAAMRWKGRQFD